MANGSERDRVTNVVTPHVSVIIITYNQEQTIAQALESVLAQVTEFSVEILVGDDCSTDGTRAEVDRLAALHPDRILPIYPPANVGAQRNFINCHDRARGAIVAFCEGDDFWIDPHKLQQQVDDLDANPQCDLSFTRGYEIRADGSQTPGWDYGDGTRIVPVVELFGHFRWIAPSASLVWRRSATRQLERVVADAPFLDIVVILMASARGGAVYRPNPTVGYRIASPGSFTATQETASRSKRREFYRKASRTLVAACDLAELPVETIQPRLDDYCLAISKLYVEDQQYGQAIRALSSVRFSFLLSGLAKLLRRLVRP